MKILFTRFPLESRHGGAEVQTLSLMQGLMQRGHAVSFLGSCPTMLRLCREHYIPFAELDIGPPPVSMWTAATFLWRQYGIRQKLTAAFRQFHDLDAICMLSLSEKILLSPAAVDAGTNVLWIEHDTVGRWLARNPWLALLRSLSGRVRTICVSELSRMLYVRLGWDADRTITIPNGINLGSLADGIMPRPEGFHIGCMARLSEEKGIDILVEAIITIPDAFLTIVGDGPEEQNVRDMIRRNHLENRVTIAARVENPGPFYRSLDLFVLPSRKHDPFGLVAAEAMATGVPVIVTDACGIAGYLHNGMHADIVPAGSADALSAAMTTMMNQNDRRERIGRGGKEKALRDFSHDAMIDEYQKIMSEKR